MELEKIHSELIKSKKIPLLVSIPSNVYYISRFRSSNAYILFLDDEILFFTDGRYIDRAYRELAEKGIKICAIKRSPIPFLARLIRRGGMLFLEDGISFSFYNEVKKIKGVEVKVIASPILEMREQKSEEEIAKIKVAVSYIECAFEHAYSVLKEGISEWELKTEIEYFIRRNFRVEPSFDIIVLFGENTANPHGISANRRLRYGDLVLIDMGCDYEGYKSDMTRTLLFGGKRKNEWEWAYKMVMEMKRLAEEYIHSVNHPTNRKVALLSYNKAKKEGVSENYLHSLGHGVGIDIHEKPFLSRKAKETEIKDSSIFTIEPGLYFKGKGGIRIEDMYLYKSQSLYKLQTKIGYDFIF